MCGVITVMEQIDDTQQPKQLSSGLDVLPIELLAYIFSLLPTSRDIVRLRYVSRKMRNVSKTFSLWSNFCGLGMTDVEKEV